MKVRIEKLSEKEIIRTLDNLYTAASALKGREAIKMFLRDLLTKSERIMLGRRIIIARKLLRGETYRQISGSLGVGHDTILRVEKWLNDQMPGYEKAITEMEKEFDRRQEKKLYATSTLYRLKKKYPLHFLLFPTPKINKEKEDY
ncbi:MAG TPA: Trp family transcriptional regulator [Candidatus Paceibacterota bacterium]